MKHASGSLKKDYNRNTSVAVMVMAIAALMLLHCMDVFAQTAGLQITPSNRTVDSALSVRQAFFVYDDATSELNRFYPTGFTGSRNKLWINVSSAENPFSGQTCIKMGFQNVEPSQKNAIWSAIHFQNPPYNWVNRTDAHDLSGYSRLVFWARGKTGSEIISSARMGGGGEASFKNPETGIGPIALTTSWTKYEIVLNNRNLSNVIIGFSVGLNAADISDDGAVYIDNIHYI